MNRGVLGYVLIGISIKLAFGQYALCAGTLCAGDQCRDWINSYTGHSNPPPSQPKETGRREDTLAQVPHKRTQAKASAGNSKDRIIMQQAHAEDGLEQGNLPKHMVRRGHQIQPTEGVDGGSFFLTFGAKKGFLTSTRAGSELTATIDQAILVSPSTPNPIVATITSGALKGATLLGEASFGKELKCVLLNFTLLKSKDGATTYQLKASGLAPTGEACLEGEYESKSGRFFVAEMLATAGAVMLDSQVSRSQNAQGNYVEEPSLSNAGKKGAAGAIAKSAEYAANSMKSAPEWTKLKGFQEIRVIFQSDAVEN